MDRKIILNRMRNNPFFMTGMITAFILVVLLLLAPVITRYDPIANNLREAKLAPEYFARGIDGHVLGTDQLGRDIYTRVLYGGRASLLLAGYSITSSSSSAAREVSSASAACSPPFPSTSASC